MAQSCPLPALSGRWRDALFLLLIATLFALIPASAHAQVATFGEAMCNAFWNMGTLPGVIQAISWIGGVILIVAGLGNLRTSSEGTSRDPMRKGILEIIAGGALLSLPGLLEFLANTLFRYGDFGGGNTSCAAGGASNAGGADLATMLINFTDNIKDPITYGVVAVAWVLGVFFIAKGIFKAARYGQDPRAYSMNSIITHLASGAILVVLAQTMETMLGTIFGSGDIMQFSGLNWTALGIQESGRANEAIRAALIFIQLVGLIAFLRGWVMIKHAVEGSGQQTIGQGLTHVLGGAVAVNIGMFLQLAEATFGLPNII